jgi:hypothetical protein
MNVQYANTGVTMEETSPDAWVARCSHRLRERWRTVDLPSLEELARQLWSDERLRAKRPEEAATEWLRRGIPNP